MFWHKDESGPFIYVEITVDPPIQGIEVYIDFCDPAFSMAGNTSPTNYRDISEPDSGAYSASNNPDLTDDEYYLLWGSHSPWVEDSLKELGDNYNYYHKHTWSSNPNSIFQQYLDQHGVPEDDPIRKHAPAAIPCFDKCSVRPVGYLCTNGGCYSPYTLTTNIYGKAATYFDTSGHGGDNFTFRAYTENLPRCPEPCLDSGVSRTITNWRKIYVDYSFMEDRGDNYPDCPYDQDKEYLGIHELSDEVFNQVAGAFDDAFIEIVKHDQYEPDAHYHSYIPWIASVCVTYGDLATYYSFRPDPPFDTVVLFGVDHLASECYGEFGTSIAHWDEPAYHDAFYNLVAVGGIYDILQTRDRKIIRMIEVSFDDATGEITATHELGHCLLQTDDAHTAYDHGVMIGPWDRNFGTRSYFHAGHIIELRKGLKKFDVGY